MSSSAPSTVSLATGFQKSVVETALRQELLQVATATAEFNGISMPAGTTQQSTMSIQLDSLAVVDVLCSIEPIAGFQIEDHVVKPGGYGSVDAAVKDLMPKLEKEWSKKNSKGGKK